MDEMDQNEELFRAWIGEKKQEEYYCKMKNGGFNWAAFFLSDLLMITRKMYLELFIIFVVLFFISASYMLLDVPDEIVGITTFAIKLIMGFTYYYMYRWSIARKIKRYQKKGLTYEKQLEIARKKGGDKITLSVVLIIIAELIFYIIVQM